MYKRRVFLGLLFSIAASVILNFGGTDKVAAAPTCPGSPHQYGAMEWTGYFFGNQQCTGGDFVFPGGEHATSASGLVSDIESKYNGTNDQEKVGAAFIIMTMMGEPAGTDMSVIGSFSTPGTLGYKWAALVTQYGNTPGLINFNLTTPSDFSCQNTFYQPNYKDVADYRDCSGTQSVPAIAFYNPSNPSQIVYTIKTLCGNPIGSLNPLPNPATGDINGVDVDSTSGANLGGSFKPSISVNPANASAQSTNAFYFTGLPAGGSDGTTFTAYTVSAPASYTYNGETYTPVRSTFCDSTDHPGCDSRLTTSGTSDCNPPSGQPCDIIYSDGRTTQDIHLKTNHVINMRWFWAKSTGTTTFACPVQSAAGVDIAAVAASFGPGNDDETTYSPSGNPKDSHTPPPSGVAYTETVRHVVSDQIVSAKDANTGASLPVDTTKNTINFTNSASAYPYDTNKATVSYTDKYYETITSYDKDGKQTGQSTSGTMGPSAVYPEDPSSSNYYAAATAGTTTVGECYYREFTVHPKSDTNVNSVTFNNDENPSLVTEKNGVKVTFNLPDSGGTKQVRSPMKINALDYYNTYKIARSGSDSCSITLGSSPYTYTFPVIGSATTDGQQISLSPPQSQSIGVSVGSGSTQLMPGDRVCAEFVTKYQTGKIDENGNIISGSGQVSTDPWTYSEHVVNEPYFKVFGGDVSVGGTFGTTLPTGASVCTPNGANAGAGVYGWNTADGEGGIYSQTYAGAGAQFAITALGNISGAGSDQNNINANSAAPANNRGNIGLSFANTTNTLSSGLFGGHFGSAPCIPDYYNDLPTGIAKQYDNDMQINASTSSGSYWIAPPSGTVTIHTPGSSGQPIPNGEHITIYVEGNAYISTDMKFDDASWHSMSDIPSFTVVAKGNIYIDSGVRELTGIYIAEPTNPSPPPPATPSADGVIYDCATMVGSTPQPMASSSLYDDCNTQLVVNGSFIAQQVDLMRTRNAAQDQIASSLRGARTDETNFTSSSMIVDAVSTSTCVNGVPVNGLCNDAQYHPGSSGSSGYYGAPWTYGGTSTMAPGDDCYNAGCSGCTTSYSLETCISGNVETYYWGTYYAGSSGSAAYYSCPSGESVSGSQCTAKTTWTCPDGTNAPPSHKCSVTVVPTNAAEVFNYSPVFWMNVALSQPTPMSAGYDSIISLPPIL